MGKARRTSGFGNVLIFIFFIGFVKSLSYRIKCEIVMSNCNEMWIVK